jgi:hypothetical protein
MAEKANNPVLSWSAVSFVTSLGPLFVHACCAVLALGGLRSVA